MDLEPVGNYAVRIMFDDLHSTGMYSWRYLYHLGQNQERLWAAYLEELERQGLEPRSLEQHPIRRDRQGRSSSRIKLLQLDEREQFSPDERGNAATRRGAISSGIALASHRGRIHDGAAAGRATISGLVRGRMKAATPTTPAAAAMARNSASKPPVRS